jgi:hypothetical protein
LNGFRVRASQWWWAHKKEEVVSSCNISKVDAENLCPLRYDSFASPAALDGCGHRFCLECVLQWSENHNQCPCCRQEFVQVSQDNVPVRIVLREKDFRSYINETYPALFSHELALVHDANELVVVKHRA